MHHTMHVLEAPANYSPSNCPGLLTHHFFFLYIGLQSHPFTF